MPILTGAIYPETASYQHSGALDSIAQAFYPYLSGDISSALVSGKPAYSLAMMPRALNYKTAKAYSFKDDYYYRIHFLPPKVQFGNITGETERKQYIWNAYLENKMLNSVIKTNAHNINHAIPSLPYEFKPSEEIETFYRLNTNGPILINAQYLFDFSGEKYNSDVTGQRIVVFPYRPNYRHSKQYQFYTDVINSYKKEQRFSLRKLPRILWAFDYQFQDDNKIAQIKIMAQGWAERKYAFLDFFDERKSEDTTAVKDKTITVDDASGIAMGDTLTLWQSDTHYECAQIERIENNRLHFKYPLEKSYIKPDVVPTYFGHMPSGFSFSETQDQITAKASFLSEETREKESNTYPLFKSFPIINEPSVFLSSLNTKLLKSTQTFDAINGFFIDQKEAEIKAQYALTWNPQNKAELKKLEAFICYLKGKYRPFWISSWKEDTQIVERVDSNFTKLKIKNLNLHRFKKAQNWHVIINGVHRYFSTISAERINDETESIELSQVIGFEIPAGTPLSLMTLYRSNTDNIKISIEPYLNSKISLPVVEISDGSLIHENPGTVKPPKNKLILRDGTFKRDGTVKRGAN